MKKILCYGDSNTFGYIPENSGRYDKDSRWCGVLANLLQNCEVVEEGMNNRTGFFKNPAGLKQSGGEYLSVFLQNCKDIDICILAVGTNDAQFFYELDEEKTEAGLKNLINSVREANPLTKIIIIPPVKITENILKSGFAMMFDRNSIEKIEKVFPVFEKTAKQNDCLYFDFNKFAVPSVVDGLHYSAQSHKIIGEELAKFICENFS